jgi:hypothetical protein
MSNINTDQILTELENRFFDIPFENSQFQDKAFLITAQHTPARAYRAIGLRMFSKIQAIKELKYGRQLEEVELEELQETIDTSTNKFEIRKAQIEKEKKLSMRGYTNKLLNDAIAELNFLYSELQKFPAYTREQFEAEEAIHFDRRLNQQLQAQGAKESLLFMHNTDTFDKMCEAARLEIGQDTPDVSELVKQIEQLEL